MKNKIITWLNRLAADPEISYDAFRLSLRLAAKVRDDSLFSKLSRARSKEIVASLTDLITSGYLVEEGINPLNRRETCFRLTPPGVQS